MGKRKFDRKEVGILCKVDLKAIIFLMILEKDTIHSKTDDRISRISTTRKNIFITYNYELNIWQEYKCVLNVIRL